MAARRRDMSRTTRVKDTAALVAVLCRYWTVVFPRARRELARWHGRACAIPDPLLRALALRTLEQESGLAEGAAIFATLVPERAVRERLVRLLVAWQVAYDYVDTIGEDVAERACDHARIYALLAAALDPAAPWVADVGDGGYLAALVACCRASVAALPSFAAIGPLAARAAVRCAEGQALTHAVALDGPQALRAWALAQPGAADYRWWEVAAGAISSLAVHALLTTAALPHAGAAVGMQVDAAYFPSICALSTLLDSAIDAADDAGTENHRCTDYYADERETSQRVAAIARTAAAQARALPHGRAHAAIVAGMTAYYATAGRNGHERLHRDVAAALAFPTGPLLWTLRLRGRLRRRPEAVATPRRLRGPRGLERRRRARRRGIVAARADGSRERGAHPPTGDTADGGSTREAPSGRSRP